MMVAPKEGGERALSGGLDRYWTDRNTAADVMSWVNSIIPANVSLVEPSAGDGSFIDAPGNWRAAFDISPAHPKVIKKDWFNTTQEDIPAHPWAMIGNPPFGSASNTAINFMKHAVSLGASYIGFILPPTWRRGPCKDRAPRAMHWIDQMDLSGSTYILPNGTKTVHDRVFVLWEVLDQPRPKLVCPSIGVEWSSARTKKSTHCLRVAGGNAGVWLDMDKPHNPSAVRYLSIPFDFDQNSAQKAMFAEAKNSTVQTYITKHEVMSIIDTFRI